MQVEAEAPRPTRGRTRAWKKAIVQVRAGRDDPDLRRPRRDGLPDADPQAQADQRRAAASSSYPDFAEITKTEPERSLIEGLKKSGGRNSYGRITARHRGGGAKRRYRKIDFKRRKDGVPARSRRSSTTPTAPPTSRCCTTPTARSATSSRRPRLNVGMTGRTPAEAPTSRSATACRSASMPTGTLVHNVELKPGQRRPDGRSAGAAIQLVAKDGDMATLRLPSGEMRLVRAECRATVGVIGNADHQNIKVGKAGRSATWASARRRAASR